MMEGHWVDWSAAQLVVQRAVHWVWTRADQSVERRVVEMVACLAET